MLFVCDHNGFPTTPLPFIKVHDFPFESTSLINVSFGKTTNAPPKSAFESTSLILFFGLKPKQCGPCRRSNPFGGRGAGERTDLQALRWAKSLSRLNTQRAIHENLPGTGRRGIFSVGSRGIFGEAGGVVEARRFFGGRLPPKMGAELSQPICFSLWKQEWR